MSMLSYCECVIMSYNTLYVCPYCAYEGQLIEFRLKQKKGYSHHKKQCPDCFNIMFKETLTQEVTIKQWATWLYSTCREIGGYDKIKWTKLFERLKTFGISYEFWDEWKKAKELTASEIRVIVEGYYEPVNKQRRLI